MTAWLDMSERGPMAVAEILRGPVMVGALVHASDLFVVLRKPRWLNHEQIPDGLTDRPVFEVNGRKVSLEFDLQSGWTADDVPCEHVGLVRAGLDWEGLVGGQPTSTCLDQRAELVGQRSSLRVGQIDCGGLVFGGPEVFCRPALLFGAASDPARRLVALRACGEIMVGSVKPEDLMPEAPMAYGSNYRCPRTGQHTFEGVSPLRHPVTCHAPVRLFVRATTFEDEVGVLYAGARIQVDRSARGETTLVSVADPPALPIKPAHYAVRTLDLASCTADGG